MRWNQATDWLRKISGVHEHSLRLGKTESIDLDLSADVVWWRLLSRLEHGTPRHTRQTKSYENLGVTYTIDPTYPLVTNPERNVSLSFAVGEVIWTMSGEARLEVISPYNKALKNFLVVDDSGVVLGAYGPKIVEQLPKVIQLLMDDNLSSRRAMIYISDSVALMNSLDTGNPSLPCTSSIQFLVQENKVYCFVSMRSQDIWLGFPYDVFLFCHLLNAVVYKLKERGYVVSPGYLIVTVGTLHLYDTVVPESHGITFPRSVWELPFDPVNSGLITIERELRKKNSTQHFDRDSFFSHVLYRFWRPDSTS